MSERGVFAMDRGWFNHPVFADEPFTEREAWAWLISEAAWKPRKKRADGKIISLDRGQLCHSVRFMAEAWGWSKSRIERFLKRLENRDMIERDHGTRTPIITLCNYSKFQRVALPERDNYRDNYRDKSGTTAGQQRDKLEYIEDIKDIEEEEVERASAPTIPGRSQNFEVDVLKVIAEIQPSASPAPDVPLPSRKERPPPGPKATRLPPDFPLTDAMIAFARREGLPDDRIRREFDKFHDHWLSAGGPSSRKADWSAALRNWFRSAVNGFGQPRGYASGGNGGADGSRLAAAQRAAARFPDQAHVPRERADIRGDGGRALVLSSRKIG
jgi:DNA-binding MarR family transcriptional regulator